MAITRTAKGTATSKTAGNLTLSNVSVTAGATLVVCWNCDTTIIPTISYDGVNLTDAISTTYGIGGILSAGIAYLSNVTGGTGDLVMGTSTTAKAMAAIQLDSLAASPLDKTVSDGGNSTTPSSGATATTAQADEILIGAIGTNGPSGDAAGSWSNSFTAGQRDGTTGGAALTNVTISEGYRIVTATGAYTAAKTSITSRRWAALIATFKEAAAPSQTGKMLLMF